MVKRPVVYLIAIIVIVAIIASAIILLSTRPAPSPTTITVTKEVLTTSVVTVTKATPAPVEKVINILLPAGPEFEYIRDKALDFEKAYGISVRIEIAPRGIYTEKYIRELMEKRGIYDIVAVTPQDIPRGVSLKGLISLDEYLTPEEKKAFFKNVLAAYTYKGKLYALPFMANARLLFYRKDLIDKFKDEFYKEFGYYLPDPAKQPWTWRDLLNVAKFFTKDLNGDGKIDIYGIFIPGVYWSLYSNYLEILWSIGWGILDENGNPIVQEKPGVEALKFLLELTKYSPPGWESMNFFDGDTLMKQGKIFCYFNWAYIASDFYNPEKAGKVYGKVGIGLPIANRTYSAQLGGFGLAVTAGSKNKELAVKFIKWASSKDVVKGLCLTGNIHVPRKDVAEDPELISKFPWIQILKEAVAHSKPAPRVPYWPELKKAIADAILMASRGEKTPEEALEWLKNKILEMRS